ncbi:hypothetical protein BX661DRAFT_181531 [Kickxella alabastrina]|uniref:uncharacterized protein n=1 Tax=Kickxella alabastrina TaxID=61397 RepID=UPI00221E8670|nr:uncharacterized protein BX661DRAFT_181531 [Kickxella alabastrina]KAI7829193.1 hypothetical protein BX661DRAFT_181531 [Kickxella alabastrina]KAJ1946873.1 hypothetical protein GGF37_000879 [Kickxella alabastrina]
MSAANSKSKSKPQSQTQSQKSPSPTLWTKAFTRDLDWRKDELRNVVFWVISLFSLVLGTLLGVLDFQGLPCLALYFATVVVVPSFYWNTFLGVDEEDFGGKMEILGDSLGPAAAMFVLSWVGTFSMIYG